MKWDPQQYLRFDDDRGRPFFDLIGRVAANAPRHVVDLGCGPGNLTALLPQRWPGATVEGIDSSAEMIAGASAPGVRFSVGDVREWQPASDVDVVISNAVLQWVPGHLELLRSWATSLGSGAWLAWQVPGNFDSPSHTLMRELAESPRWVGQLGGVLRHTDAVAQPAEYTELLLESGFEVDCWQTTYLHVLAGADPVLEWVRGSGLRPVLQALPPADGAEFEKSYRELLRTAYPQTRHGGTIFPFRRTFAVGRKR